MKKLKTLELFGGIGAPRMALDNIGINIKAVDYVEILPNAVKAYNAMYNHDYDPQNVLDWNLDVDLLVHGSPCQDFSNAGRNDLSSGRSILYERTLEIIEKELNPRPKYVIWENVKGLLSKRHIHHFYHYLNVMDILGYRNYYQLLYAYEFGIPQTRPRVFTISIRKDIDQFFDFDVLERKPMRPLRDFFSNNIEEIKKAKANQTKSRDEMRQKCKNITNAEYCNTITTKQDRYPNSGIIDFEDYYRFLTPRECWALQGYDTVSPNYKESENFYTIPRATDGKMINGQYNRVWKSDKYCGTIPASVVLKIGITDENGVLHYRDMTPTEAWLLQGYELSTYDKVKATGISDTTMYMLAGNSICVPVLEAIFKELLIDKKSTSNKYLYKK